MESKGDIIRERRLFMKISQQKLAEGICSQSMISRLENNQFNIGYSDLESILKRLNMQMSDLLYGEVENESAAVQKQLDDLRSKGQYDDIEEILDRGKAKDFWESSIELNAYFYWHHGLIRYVKYQDSEGAHAALDEAVSRSVDNFLMKGSLPEIYIAKGNFYNDQNHLDLEWYKKAEESYRNIGRTIYKLEMKILYNMIRTNCSRNEYQRVIRDCDKAIKVLDDNDSVYLICEIFYFKMLSLMKAGRYSEYMEVREKIDYIYKVKNKEWMLQNLDDYSVENNLV
ncbi:helix-turn-helix domain-containing protein [Corticicoccus populi]|uniref:Helix-turn-helix domain-containing protein n=1 Tax=Corticicoccus populi TaxID=1812821 RepID=A0ABW5WY50_9STAP